MWRCTDSVLSHIPGCTFHWSRCTVLGGVATVKGVGEHLPGMLQFWCQSLFQNCVPAFLSLMGAMVNVVGCATFCLRSSLTNIEITQVYCWKSCVERRSIAAVTSPEIGGSFSVSSSQIKSASVSKLSTHTRLAFYMWKYIIWMHRTASHCQPTGNNGRHGLNSQKVFSLIQ